MSNNGLYIAAAGGMAQYERLEHLTNNLANVSTTGYKGDKPVFSVQRPDYTSQLRHHPAPGSADSTRALAFATLDEVNVDMTQGAFETTGDPLHLAVGGDGFFAIKTPTGTLYTRAGDFGLDADGRLVNPSGFPVLGQGGAEINLKGGDIQIDDSGRISVGGQPGPSLSIATFDDDVQMNRVGHTLFEAVGPQGQEATPIQATSPQVMQGVLETSNVNPIAAMVDLIETNRAFEQFTKSLQSMDQLDEKVIGQLAKPR